MPTDSSDGPSQYTHSGIVVPCELRDKGAWIPLVVSMHPEQFLALKDAGQTPSVTGAQVNGLIDTGATRTCIPNTIAQRLGLQQIQTTPVSGVGGGAECPVYLAEIQIGPWRQEWQVVGTGPRIPSLIGRDVLRFFSLLYIGPDELFILYHGVPPFIDRLTQAGFEHSGGKQFEIKLS